jgi:male-specific lethal 1
MNGSTLDAMADAIDSAAVIVMVMTSAYKASANCKLEAEYAHLKNVQMIPVLIESGYRPDGWLGMLLGSKLYFDFTSAFDDTGATTTLFHESMMKLKHEISMHHLPTKTLLSPPPVGRERSLQHELDKHRQRRNSKPMAGIGSASTSPTSSLKSRNSMLKMSSFQQLAAEATSEKVRADACRATIDESRNMDSAGAEGGGLTSQRSTSNASCMVTDESAYPIQTEGELADALNISCRTSTEGTVEGGTPHAGYTPRHRDGGQQQQPQQQPQEVEYSMPMPVPVQHATATPTVDVLGWSADDVCHWLESKLRLPQYVRQAFAARQIDGVVLCMLTPETLQDELGVADLFHRQKILGHLHLLKRAMTSDHKHAHAHDLRQLPPSAGLNKSGSMDVSASLASASAGVATVFDELVCLSESVAGARTEWRTAAVRTPPSALASVSAEAGPGPGSAGSAVSALEMSAVSAVTTAAASVELEQLQSFLLPPSPSIPLSPLFAGGSQSRTRLRPGARQLVPLSPYADTAATSTTGGTSTHAKRWWTCRWCPAYRLIYVFAAQAHSDHPQAHEAYSAEWIAQVGEYFLAHDPGGCSSVAISNEASASAGGPPGHEYDRSGNARDGGGRGPGERGRAGVTFMPAARQQQQRGRGRTPSALVCVSRELTEEIERQRKSGDEYELPLHYFAPAMDGATAVVAAAQLTATIEAFCFASAPAAGPPQ